MPEGWEAFCPENTGSNEGYNSDRFFGRED